MCSDNVTSVEKLSKGTPLLCLFLVTSMTVKDRGLTKNTECSNHFTTHVLQQEPGNSGTLMFFFDARNSQCSGPRMIGVWSGTNPTVDGTSRHRGLVAPLPAWGEFNWAPVYKEDVGNGSRKPKPEHQDNNNAYEITQVKGKPGFWKIEPKGGSVRLSEGYFVLAEMKGRRYYGTGEEYRIQDGCVGNEASTASSNRADNVGKPKSNKGFRARVIRVICVISKVLSASSVMSYVQT